MSLFVNSEGKLVDRQMNRLVEVKGFYFYYPAVAILLKNRELDKIQWGTVIYSIN